MARRQAGMALIFVLFILFVLTTVVLAFSHLYSQGLSFGGRRLSQAEARSAAAAGIEFLFTLVRTDPEVDRQGFKTTLNLTGLPVALAVEDEGSKINLNAAPSSLLARLPEFQEAGRLESFLEWRQKNGLLLHLGQLKTISGWENVDLKELRHLTVTGKLNINTLHKDYYLFDAILRSLGVDPAEAANRANYFELTAEPPWEDLEAFFANLPLLADLKGKLEQVLTATATINVNTAPRVVLRAICAEYGPGAAWADTLIDARPIAELTPFLAGLEGKNKLVSALLTTQSTYLQLAATGAVREQQWRIQTKVERISTKEKTWQLRILDWREDGGGHEQELVLEPDEHRD